MIIEPGFKLNLHDRDLNPCFESHDPSMMFDPASGYYYSYSTDAAIHSQYRQGIPIRRSRDLVHFEFIGYALSDRAIAEARDNGPDYKPTGGFWAPFAECVRRKAVATAEGCEHRSGDTAAEDREYRAEDAALGTGGYEYRLYYSATKAFGSSESRIWLAVAQTPEGPFENRGIVADTWFTDDTLPNAIDPHVVDTPEGQKYLIYGSFFGGIYIKELDPETGLCRPNDNGADTSHCGTGVRTDATDTSLCGTGVRTDVTDMSPCEACVKEAGACESPSRALGRRIAIKPKDSPVDGPEGAAVAYNAAEGYFYLFLSYGWLGDDYDIRVGRSRSVTGPYLDISGRSLDGESLGTRLAGSYSFTSGRPYACYPEEMTGPCTERVCNPAWKFAGWRGPGHGVPFYDPQTGDWFFVHHVRDGAECLCHKPENAAERRTYFMHYLVVRRMFFVDGMPVLSPEPYAGEQAESRAVTLTETDKKSVPGLTGDGEWISFGYEDNAPAQAAKLFEIMPLKGIRLSGYDFENSCMCELFTGYSPKGECVWGKLK